MTAPRAILIADDLTGSLDSIAPFAVQGMTCVTAVSTEAIASALLHAPDVIAVNLGTREAPAEEAATRAIAATRALIAAAGPGTIWIKKIDSRLKGPIAAEIVGASQILHPDRILICPAIPDLGRIVRQGLLRGAGVEHGLAVADVVPRTLRCDIPDATSDADLDRIARSVQPGTLVVAARGLAAALARRIAPGPMAGTSLEPGAIGFAIGSRDPVTLAQLAQLLAHGGPPLIEAPDGEVPTVSAAGSFVIQATPGVGAVGSLVASRLAAGVTGHVAGLKSLVLSGGETAAAVLQLAEIRLLRVEGEVLPGLALSRALDRPGFPSLVTKSGGFGPPDTLLRLWQAAQSLEGCQRPWLHSE